MTSVSRSSRLGSLALAGAFAVAAAVVLALVAAAPAFADQTMYRTINGAEYKITADYNDDRDDGPLGWHLEADYRGPVSKNKTTYTIPKTVKVAFQGKTRTVRVTEIDSYAFYKLKKVKKVVCKAAITEIGDKAFYGCKKLTTFKSNAPITSIGDRAFEGCKNLKTFKSKASRIHDVGYKAFFNCTKLASVPKLTAVEYGEDDADDYQCEIGSKAFANCKSLKGVTVQLKSYRLTVGTAAFENCTKLAHVKLEGSYGDVRIDSRAFKGCTALTRVTGLNKLDLLHANHTAFVGTPLDGKVQNIW